MPKTKNILIVDDSEMQLTMIESALTRFGYVNIFKANDGKAALQIAHNTQFDVIITDIHMPIMNGFRLIQELRKIELHKHTPIAIITTATTDAAKIKAQAIGTNAYVIKPLTVEALKSVLDKLLHNTNHQAQLTTLS